MSSPLITIIMATFNSQKYLQQAIDSVKNQSYQKIEFIIIDGGSVDNTVEIIKKNQANISYWISEKDTGIYNAWNKGLRVAKGDWVSFLGSDDYLWENNVIEIAAKHLERLELDFKIVYSKIMFLNQGFSKPLLMGKPWEEVKYNFPAMNVLPHPCVLHHKSLFSEYGLFDDTFKILGDYEFMLRFLDKVKKIQIPDLIFVGMRYGGVSSNPKFALKSLKESRRAKVKHNVPTTTRYYISLISIYFRAFLVLVLGEFLSQKIFNFTRQIRIKLRLQNE
jgi:glycosyltransferase involved in cell wall biosynthesis